MYPEFILNLVWKHILYCSIQNVCATRNISLNVYNNDMKIKNITWDLSGILPKEKRTTDPSSSDTSEMLDISKFHISIPLNIRKFIMVLQMSKNKKKLIYNSTKNYIWKWYKHTNEPYRVWNMMFSDNYIQVSVNLDKIDVEY